MAVVYPDPGLNQPAPSMGSKVLSFAEQHVIVVGVLLLAFALLIGALFNKLKGSSTSSTTDQGPQTLYVPTQNTFENIYANTAPLNSPTTTTTINNDQDGGPGILPDKPPYIPPPGGIATQPLVQAHIRAKTTAGPYKSWDAQNSGVPLRSAQDQKQSSIIGFVPFGSQATLLSEEPTNGWYSASFGGKTGYLSTVDVTGISET